MGKIIVVTGSPGAGKTTIVESLKGQKQYKLINVGTLMAELAMEKGFIEKMDMLKAHDVLRFLSKDHVKYNALRDFAFSRIAAEEGNVIVDTHASVEAGGRYVPGLPFDAIEIIKDHLVALIYVDSTTKDIMERRSKDKTRVREEPDSAYIKMQRTINVSALSYYMTYFNVPIYIINNRQGKLEHTIDNFQKAVKHAVDEKR